MPIAAIVAIADDGDSPTPARAGTGNMMPGGNTDTTSPTVSMIEGSVGTGANANTITWTVTFSEPVRNLAIGQFTVSGGGTVAMLSSTSGTTITVVSTHTDVNDGDIVLTFMPGTTAADNAGNNFAMNSMPMSTEVAITVVPNVNYLEDLLTVGGSARVRSAHTVQPRGGNDVNREITRTAIGTTTTVTIAENQGGATTSYVFNSADANNNLGQAVSNDGNLLIRKFEGENVGFHIFYSGTNVVASDGTRDINNFDILTYNNLRSTDVTQPTGTAAMVTYTGEYAVVSAPSGSASAESVTTSGDFDLNIDLSATTNAIQAGSITRDSDGNTNGMFSGGSVFQVGTSLNFLSGTFTGTAGAVNGQTISITGDFVGANAEEVILRGESTTHIFGLHGAIDSN